jgi:hypothetical protein
MKEIIFTLDFGDEHLPEKYYPVPAKNMIPEWYKKMVSFHADENNAIKKSTQTMKRCMPVFDSFTAGYLILTHSDITVSVENGITDYKWAYDTGDLITFHDGRQMIGYRGFDLPMGAPKLKNPWGIKTPKGYSCYFMPPPHRNPSGLRILEGVVDTDTYTNSVQFPFLLDEGFVGDIPAGTPIAQVIPFKRDNFKMSIGSNADRTANHAAMRLAKSTWLNGYRNFFRQEKNYQ